MKEILLEKLRRADLDEIAMGVCVWLCWLLVLQLYVFYTPFILL